MAGKQSSHIPPIYKTTLDVGSPGGLVRIFVRFDFDAEVIGNSPSTVNEVRESEDGWRYRERKDGWAILLYISSYHALQQGYVGLCLLQQLKEKALEPYPQLEQAHG